MDGAGAPEEEFQLRPQLIELARVTRDDEIGALVRFHGFGQRQAARRAIELVPALTRARWRKGWMEQGWHCEGAAAYACRRSMQIAIERPLVQEGPYCPAHWACAGSAYGNAIVNRRRRRRAA